MNNHIGLFQSIGIPRPLLCSSGACLDIPVFFYDIPVSFCDIPVSFCDIPVPFRAQRQDLRMKYLLWQRRQRDRGGRSNPQRLPAHSKRLRRPLVAILWMFLARGEASRMPGQRLLGRVLLPMFTQRWRWTPLLTRVVPFEGCRLGQNRLSQSSYRPPQASAPPQKRYSRSYPCH